MIKIRAYQTSDFQQVKEILEKGNLYWETSDNEQSLKRKIKQNPDAILVATADDKVVGTLFIVEDFLPLLFRLAVHPDCRGKGIGKALIQRGEEILKQKGYNHVNLIVALENTELQKYYEQQDYEKGNKYIWMVKEFKNFNRNPKK